MYGADEKVYQALIGIDEDELGNPSI